MINGEHENYGIILGLFLRIYAKYPQSYIRVYSDGTGQCTLRPDFFNKWILWCLGRGDEIRIIKP